MFTNLIQMIRQVISKVFPFRNIETVESVETPLSSEMITAMELWFNMYTGKSPWLADTNIKSLNLPVMICSEMARQVTLDLKWSITGGKTQDGDDAQNPRSTYLKEEFEKLMHALRTKLEQGCAAGGMTIRPYHKSDGHIYFDWTMAWNLYPVAFDDEGNLRDVIFRDTIQEGKVTYTRLERHCVQDDGTIRVSQRAFKSTLRDNIGTEIPLKSVSQWKDLPPDTVVRDTEGQLFGWYKVALANNIAVDDPLGVSVFSRAVDLIKQADYQFSNLCWEYEGGQLAIDVDPQVLVPKATGKTGPDGRPVMEMPKLNDRLFRGVDLGKDESYNVFNPSFRDVSLRAGLNDILIRIEDLCGISRGTLSDANTEARTATELKIMQQRTYATVADNQAALERCLRDVIRTMNVYCDLYGLAPAGDYDVSFEWDDSIITDSTQQLGERLQLTSLGVSSKAELRMWYYGETEAQARAAIQKIVDETVGIEAALAPPMPDEPIPGNPKGADK